MRSWTEPIVRALDSRAAPLACFIRDDDGGWAHHRLIALLNLHAHVRAPIDLAVIPTCVSPALADALVERIERGDAIGLHQHGFSHANHESTGRKCEFGRSRGFDEQLADIQDGRAVLRTAFGPRVDPIFTPPWNRCVADTGRCLLACGFEAISQDHTAGQIGIHGLVECPIQIDWLGGCRRRGGSLAEWSAQLALAICGADEPLGWMLHHGEMNDTELQLWADVLEVLIDHPSAHIVSMRAAVRSLAGGRGES